MHLELKVHDSVFVPLAKWSMLLTGNYRCVQQDEMRAIRDAVHSDLDRSRSVYDWVGEVCRKLGASGEDQVPFEKYANAANGPVSGVGVFFKRDLILPGRPQFSAHLTHPVIDRP